MCHRSSLATTSEIGVTFASSKLLLNKLPGTYSFSELSIEKMRAHTQTNGTITVLCEAVVFQSFPHHGITVLRLSHPGRTVLRSHAVCLLRVMLDQRWTRFAFFIYSHFIYSHIDVSITASICAATKAHRLRAGLHERSSPRRMRQLMIRPDTMITPRSGSG